MSIPLGDENKSDKILAHKLKVNRRLPDEKKRIHGKKSICYDGKRKTFQIIKRNKWIIYSNMSKVRSLDWEIFILIFKKK